MVSNTDSQKSGKRPSATRRRVLQSGAVVSALGVTGCLGGDGGGSNDTLSYISLGGATQEASRQMFDRWSEESGVTVEHQEVSGNTELLNLISENPSNFDFTNLAHFGLAFERIQYDGELTQDIDTGEIPNYEENIQDQWKNAPPIDGHSDGIFYYMSSQGIGYNEDHVDEITSWDDLKDPELEGNVALFNSAPTRFGSCCVATGYTASEALNDEAKLDEVFQEMAEQDENAFNYWEAGNQFMQWMREGQMHAGSAWGGRVQRLNEEEDLNTAYAVPEEGAVGHTNYFAMMEETDHEDHIYDLLNWLYDRDRAIELSTMHNYPLGVTDPPEELTSLFEFVESPDELLFLDWNAVVPELSMIQQRVTEVKGG